MAIRATCAGQANSSAQVWAELSASSWRICGQPSRVAWLRACPRSSTRPWTLPGVPAPATHCTVQAALLCTAADRIVNHTAQRSGPVTASHMPAHDNSSTHQPKSQGRTSLPHVSLLHTLQMAARLRGHPSNRVSKVHLQPQLSIVVTRSTVNSMDALAGMARMMQGVKPL